MSQLPGTPMPVVGVTIQDFSFSQAAVTVKVGTTVEWANNGQSAHTATSNTGTWDSGQLSGPTTGDPYYGGGSAGGTDQYTFMAGAAACRAGAGGGSRRAGVLFGGGD